ncbi:MAG TPA: ECF transporter S component [Halanaerobiales bacterium]|nr:ECF transporter S component [Halanaerobiales bacterium]HPZ63248.1 ECF transporter S component [Halanaerobiales bacterium]HQD04474.1 ECF transporter S component [Halanaerobiales bacterium]
MTSNKTFTTRNLVLMALFIALGIVLPISFHVFGNVARVLSPMHITVFIAGALMGPVAGLVVGALTPLLSSLITSMPPLMPMLPLMFFELAVYGLVIGYLYRVKKMNIFVSLLISMLIGRIAYGIVASIMVYVFAVPNLQGNPFVLVPTMIVSGLPGIVLHLLVVPLIVKFLGNTRYFQEETE